MPHTHTHTHTHHQYHFEDLSPDDFERLIYWLVERAGYFDQVQWYGGARDKGRDVVAYRHVAGTREKWYIQAKRYQRITFATLRDGLDKLAEHGAQTPEFAPDVIVFATACPVPPNAKDQANVHARTLSLPEPYYWGRLELDEKLKAQPETEREFFGTAPPPSDSPPLFDRQQYLARIVDLYGTTQIFGQPDPVPLGDIYTDLYILDKPSAFRRFDLSQLRHDPDLLKGSKRIQGSDLLRRPEAHRLFILGKPGAGKTTFLKHIALEAAQGRLDRLPIFVTLKEWADAGGDLLPFIADQFAICGFPGSRSYIDHLLQHTDDALLLFDGLDEVQREGNARARIIAALRDFSRRYPRARCLVTCRIAATDYTFEGYAHVEVADFSAEQMETFVRKWFRATPDTADLFLQEIGKEQHRGLRELACIPLLLALLCLAFQDTLGFSGGRAGAYHHALDFLLRQWDDSRLIRRDEVYRWLSLERKHRLLASIAFQAFEQADYFLPQHQLELLIARYLAALPDTDPADYAGVDAYAALKAIEVQHGILVERAHRIYSFAHLSFQEYYTACYVVDNAVRGTLPRLLKHWADPRWREVILLTASLLDRADAFFLHFRHTLDALLAGQQLLHDFLHWAADKSTGLGAGGRAYYSCLALDPNRALDLDLAVERACAFVHVMIPAAAADLALDLAHDRVLEVEIDHARVLALDLARVLTRSLDHKLDRYSDRDPDLGRASNYVLSLARALDRDPDLRRALTGILARDRVLDRARILALAHAFQRVLDLNLVRVLDLVQALARDCVFDLALALDFKHARARDVDDARARTHTHIRDLDRVWSLALHQSQVSSEQQFHQAISTLSLPGADSSIEEVQTFAQVLRQRMIEHRNIGHEWDFTLDQIRILAKYFEASRLFIECLDLAYVSDRDTIKDTLVLPPGTWQPWDTTD